MMRRTGFLLLLAGLAACFEDPVSGGSTINGSYALQSINGAPLPNTPSASDTSRVIVVDDVITLYGGFTYAQSGHRRANESAPALDFHGTGTYSIEGTSVRLRSNETGLQRIAQINANTMTLIEPQRTWVYRK